MNKLSPINWRSPGVEGFERIQKGQNKIANCETVKLLFYSKTIKFIELNKSLTGNWTGAGNLLISPERLVIAVQGIQSLNFRLVTLLQPVSYNKKRMNS